MPDAVIEITGELAKWPIPQTEDLKKLSELTSKSLDTVTHLTEYEDEKANRILTAMAFMSAFAAVLFAGVFAHYASEFLQKLRAVAPCRFYLIETGYAVFGLYALILSIGVAYSLYGMKPRFNVPKGWKSSTTTFPKSFLFFEKINDVPPANWAKAFTATSADNLAFQYIKNNVLESYLIAGKVPLKLKPLKTASNLYIASTCILVLWLVLTGVGFAMVDLFPSPAVSGIKTSSEMDKPPSESKSNQTEDSSPNSKPTPENQSSGTAPTPSPAKPPLSPSLKPPKTKVSAAQKNSPK